MPRAGAAGICLVFVQLRHGQQRLQQRVDARPFRRAGLHHFRVAAPLAGQQAVFRQLCIDAVEVHARQVDLVQRDDDGDAGGAGVGDGLFRLRHDAVVGGDDQHGDVRDVGAAARIAVNASCPGVSTNVIDRPSFSTR